MSKTVIAIYDSLTSAQRAVAALRENAMFPETSINVISNDADDYYSRYIRLKESAPDDEEEVEVAKTGAEVGAALGAIGGLVVGLGGLFIPGIGPIIAAGPLVGTLLGTVGGAAAGGLVGALVESGIPEDDAHLYAEALRRGGSIVTVHCDSENEVESATDILGRFGPVDLEKRVEHWRSKGWSGYDPEAGPYTTEKIQTEREAYPENERPYYGSYSDTVLGPRDWFGTHEPSFKKHYEDNPATDGSYDDYKSAYRFGSRFGANERYARENWNAVKADLHKRWAKRPDATAWDKVENYIKYGWYKTKEEMWDASTPGDDFHQKQVPAYKQHFDSNPPSTGGSFEEYEPAFRFGESLGADRRLARENWNAVKAEAHRRWAKSNDASAWDKVENYVKYGWYKTKEEFWDATN